MADAFITSRGGGSGLNFSVVGGTTQPTGKENLIWVNTANAITSWEFSATQPTSPNDGMVWISNSTASTTPINALKKNGIWLYPTGASQYINGTWVDKVAKTFQNGSWKDWMVYLVHNSSNMLAGGWIISDKRTRSSVTLLRPSILTPDTAFTVSSVGTAYNRWGGGILSSEDYNCTPFKHLKLSGTVTSLGEQHDIFIGIVNRNSNYLISDAIASRTIRVSKTGAFTLDCDISQISSVGAVVYATENNNYDPARVRIDEFYLEP